MTTKKQKITWYYDLPYTLCNERLKLPPLGCSSISGTNAAVNQQDITSKNK